MQYVVKRTVIAPAPRDEWASQRWAAANTLEVNQFHPRSSDHRPRTQAKLLHDDAHLYVLFRVQDRYVRCVHTTYQSFVSRDSCVEFFLQPDPERGYFNFEVNCGGTMLLYYIEDPTRTETALFRKYTPVPKELAETVRIWHSVPTRVDPEISKPVDWTLGCAIPFSLFEPFVGAAGAQTAHGWRGNFFKCGDETSHPHWASWSPIGEILRFHQPECFGAISFAS
jgi:hypothetical protein